MRECRRVFSRRSLLWLLVLMAAVVFFHRVDHHNAPGFAAAYRQTGKAVFEYLLKTEELDNRCVDRRMKSDATLVRSYCGVKLYAIAAVHLYVAVVVYPRYTEKDLSFRLDKALKNAVLFNGRIGSHNRLQRLQNFINRL